MPACDGAAVLILVIGVGVFRVHPLIMTLGTSCVQVYQRIVIASGTRIPPFHHPADTRRHGGFCLG